MLENQPFLQTEKRKKMKKTTLILLAFLIVPLVSFSQGVGIGVKAGANFANLNFEDPDVSPESVTNFHFGGYLNLNLTDKFGITPEVLFSSQGSEFDGMKIDMTYIAIPVMLKFKPVSFLFVEAGPQFSFLTKAEMDFGQGTEDIKDQLKNNDFGLGFGAGVNLPLGFNAGARYVLGFSNISDVSEETIQNRTFQIYVGWTILGAK